MLSLWLAVANAAPDEGSVERYVAIALEGSPVVEADFARWQAAVHSVARQRTLPEPTLSFGAFVQSVETRVGPQRARVSVQQAFPWPTQLVRGGKAATAEARAAELRLEASSLEVAQAVEIAFWSLWELRETRALHAEHLTLLGGLADTARARLEVGTASLSGLQQIELSRARLEDALAAMEAEEVRRVSTLRAALGSRDSAPLPTVADPEQVLVADPDGLRARVLDHPRLQALEASVEAADQRARAAGARRLPGLTVGADWIVTGPSAMAGVPDSGKDAVAVGVGMKVPLWQGTYAHDVAAARAMEDGQRAAARGAGDRALASVDGWIAAVDDTARQVEVVRGTLLPQAQAAYESVLAEYTVGEAPISQILLAQRDLLDLSVLAVARQARHQRAWAELRAWVPEVSNE